MAMITVPPVFQCFICNANCKEIGNLNIIVLFSIAGPLLGIRFLLGKE